MRVRLTNYEKKIIDSIRQNGSAIEGIPKRPKTSEIVAALLRLAFHCLSTHEDRYRSSAKLTPREIKEQSLAVVTKRGLSKPRIRTIPPKGSKEPPKWDE